MAASLKESRRQRPCPVLQVAGDPVVSAAVKKSSKQAWFCDRVSYRPETGGGASRRCRGGD
jgi:hypothetical protein